MHLKRWLTAVVLLPLLLLILLRGTPLVFTLLVSVISLLGLREYFAIVPFPAHGKGTLSSIGVGLVAGISTFFLMGAAHKGSLGLMLLVPALNVMFLTFLILVVYAPGSSILRAIEIQIQGVVYVPFFLSFLILVRNGDKGGLWILWLWLIVAASDTGAFYWGSYHGKRPLSPRISPNKTIEGALGGLLLALVVGVGFEMLFIHEVSFGGALAFSLVAAVAGQIGDLFESALKRAGGIKDSGHLLPGHGGILDRLDGVIFAAPVAYLFKGFLL